MSGRLEVQMTRRQLILDLLRARDGALCIAAICAALPLSRDSTRAELRRMEQSGLVAINEAGRRTATVGYGDGALVELLEAGDAADAVEV
jgi:DNA-binding IclR family transcriptional regulator